MEYARGDRERTGVMVGHCARRAGRPPRPHAGRLATRTAAPAPIAPPEEPHDGHPALAGQPDGSAVPADTPLRAAAAARRDPAQPHHGLANVPVLGRRRRADRLASGPPRQSRRGRRRLGDGRGNCGGGARAHLARRLRALERRAGGGVRADRAFPARAGRRAGSAARARRSQGAHAPAVGGGRPGGARGALGDGLGERHPVRRGLARSTRAGPRRTHSARRRLRRWWRSGRRRPSGRWRRASR
jgi:hypothetical protein